ncbi:hypothetical protein [Microbacterium sp. T32]|uniref:hypothetical protein n=1 Tax=Microbacterium sp. T32 TaxID=1776083 RepID=UPI0007ABA9BE|nr:hypothetical protein [Microbacterium sp. T32]KZE43262.1 hypothetical protein AVW09_00510 [Microbacterium sp. T32]
MQGASDYVWTPSDVFGGLQLAVAVLGFGVAIWQLVRTANATAKSARALGQRLIANDLLVLLPDLEHLEDALDAAVKTTKPDKVGTALAEYARKAQRIHGHLKATPAFSGADLVDLIEASVKEARTAKEALYEGGTIDVVAVARTARQSIGKVILEAASFSASLQKGSESGTQRKQSWFRPRKALRQDG